MSISNTANGAKPPKAPRLHVSHCGVLVVAAALLTLANVPGDRESERIETFGVHITRCRHGWPLTYLTRGAQDKPEMSLWDMGMDVAEFRSTALAVDVVAAVAIIGIIVFTFDRWRRRSFRYGLRTLVATLIMAGVCIGSWRIVWQREQREQAARRAIERIGGMVWVELGGIDWVRESLAPDEDARGARKLAGEWSETFFGAFDRVYSVTLNADYVVRNGIIPAQRRRLDAPVPGSWIGCLIHVRCLNARYTGFSDESMTGFTYLTNLEHLRLSETNVGDQGLAHLKGLRKLEHLVLDRTKVSDAGLQSLAALRQLRWLDLGGTNVGDEGLAHLKGLQKLEYLVLDGTKVSDAGLRSLAALRQLRSLDLGGTNVGDEGLAHLKGLQQLEHLVLDGTKVSDAGLQSIAGLEQLWGLDLNDTAVGDEGLTHLERLSKLDDLGLDNTKVTRQGVARLKVALPDVSIHSTAEVPR